MIIHLCAFAHENSMHFMIWSFYFCWWTEVTSHKESRLCLLKILPGFGISLLCHNSSHCMQILARMYDDETDGWTKVVVDWVKALNKVEEVNAWVRCAFCNVSSHLRLFAVFAKVRVGGTLEKWCKDISRKFNNSVGSLHYYALLNFQPMVGLLIATGNGWTANCCKYSAKRMMMSFACLVGNLSKIRIKFQPQMAACFAGGQIHVTPASEIVSDRAKCHKGGHWSLQMHAGLGNTDFEFSPAEAMLWTFPPDIFVYIPGVSEFWTWPLGADSELRNLF